MPEESLPVTRWQIRHVRASDAEQLPRDWLPPQLAGIVVAAAHVEGPALDRDILNCHPPDDTTRGLLERAMVEYVRLTRATFQTETRRLAGRSPGPALDVEIAEARTLIDAPARGQLLRRQRQALAGLSRWGVAGLLGADATGHVSLALAPGAAAPDVDEMAAEAGELLDELALVGKALAMFGAGRREGPLPK